MEKKIDEKWRGERTGVLRLGTPRLFALASYKCRPNKHVLVG